jgi:hypothetical protein
MFSHLLFCHSLVLTGLYSLLNGSRTFSIIDSRQRALLDPIKASARLCICFFFIWARFHSITIAIILSSIHSIASLFSLLLVLVSDPACPLHCLCIPLLNLSSPSFTRLVIRWNTIAKLQKVPPLHLHGVALVRESFLHNQFHLFKLVEVSPNFDLANCPRLILLIPFAISKIYSFFMI